MSPFATPHVHTMQKVHYSEYIPTDNDPNGLRLAVPRISKQGAQQRIDAMRIRNSQKHQSFASGVSRFFRAQG